MEAERDGDQYNCRMRCPDRGMYTLHVNGTGDDGSAYDEKVVVYSTQPMKDCRSFAVKSESFFNACYQLGPYSRTSCNIS